MRRISPPRPLSRTAKATYRFGIRNSRYRIRDSGFCVCSRAANATCVPRSALKAVLETQRIVLDTHGTVLDTHGTVLDTHGTVLDTHGTGLDTRGAPPTKMLLQSPASPVRW